MTFEVGSLYVGRHFGALQWIVRYGSRVLVRINIPRIYFAWRAERYARRREFNMAS